MCCHINRQNDFQSNMAPYCPHTYLKNWREHKIEHSIFISVDYLSAVFLRNILKSSVTRFSSLVLLVKFLPVGPVFSVSIIYFSRKFLGG